MPDLRFWLAFVKAFTIVVGGLMALALIIEYWPWKRGSMTAEDRMLRALKIVMVLVAAVLIALVMGIVKGLAHDHDHHEFDQWYETLMMPDNPSVRCCGENDEYRCDAFVRDGETWCRVTDDRVNPNRPPVAIGTEILIPRHKYKYNQGNPTGHTLVFGRPQGDDFYVYCFVQGTGI